MWCQKLNFLFSQYGENTIISRMFQNCPTLFDPIFRENPSPSSADGS